MFLFGVFRAFIFLHTDWIRRGTTYLSVFSPNVGKWRPKKPRIRTIFTQWTALNFAVEVLGESLWGFLFLVKLQAENWSLKSKVRAWSLNLASSKVFCQDSMYTGMTDSFLKNYYKMSFFTSKIFWQCYFFYVFC